MLNYHRERFRKLTFRALALRQSECMSLSPDKTPVRITVTGNTFDLIFEICVDTQ